jgi:hypothetical protein
MAGEHGPIDGGDHAADGTWDGDLSRMISSVRADDARASRRRERTLRAAASAEATMAGVLLDLAEGRQQLTIRMTSGRHVRGSVELVALDAVALRTGAGLLTLLRLDAIVWVRRVPGQAGEPAIEPAGDRPAARPATFAALAAGLAAERPHVSLAVTGEPSLLTGELRSVGVDVLTVRLDGAPPVTAYISAPQVSELTVFASG